jgi:hypothetical protein
MADIAPSPALNYPPAPSSNETLIPQQQQSRLLNLPGELRNKIYEYVFEENTKLYTKHNGYGDFRSGAEFYFDDAMKLYTKDNGHGDSKFAPDFVFAKSTKDHRKYIEYGDFESPRRLPRAPTHLQTNPR